MAVINLQNSPKLSWVEKLNSTLHERALRLYMLVVFAHWLEHLVQIYQIYFLYWSPGQAGGLLGLWFPLLVKTEILHFLYALFMLGGLVLLHPGLAGRSRRYWTLALAVQSWHFFEHALLQMQWLTGYYLFGAAQPTSVIQLWIPRAELHLVYNLVVFIPMLLSVYYHIYQPKDEPVHTGCTCSRRQCRVRR
jgi:hypothetical protein